MKCASSLVVLGALLLPVVAPAQATPDHHPGHSAEHYAHTLEDPSRDAWQRPHEVIMALKLRPTEVVADLGAGTGYFSRRLARHAGKVLAIDVDAKLLAIAAKGAPRNLQTLLAGTDTPRLEAASVDTVFICDVAHHIGNRALYWPRVVSALKPGGRVVMIDFEKRATSAGPPVEYRISRDEMVAEMAAAGLKLKREHKLLEQQYFLEFER
ncbi:MAG: class I SAM-dependent methyltransferase [Acidobacteria bacterium]|nr:class I SAM-dependent methyltransferase [Acidobacteriota bacterium]